MKNKKVRDKHHRPQTDTLKNYPQALISLIEEMWQSDPQKVYYIYDIFFSFLTNLNIYIDSMSFIQMLWPNICNYFLQQKCCCRISSDFFSLCTIVYFIALLFWVLLSFLIFSVFFLSSCLFLSSVSFSCDQEIHWVNFLLSAVVFLAVQWKLTLNFSTHFWKSEQFKLKTVSIHD